MEEITPLPEILIVKQWFTLDLTYFGFNYIKEESFIMTQNGPLHESEGPRPYVTLFSTILE